jgi:hypothetical protein
MPFWQACQTPISSVENAVVIFIVILANDMSNKVSIDMTEKCGKLWNWAVIALCWLCRLKARFIFYIIIPNGGRGTRASHIWHGSMPGNSRGMPPWANRQAPWHFGTP